MTAKKIQPTKKAQHVVFEKHHEELHAAAMSYGVAVETMKDGKIPFDEYQKKQYDLLKAAHAYYRAAIKVVRKEPS